MTIQGASDAVMKAAQPPITTVSQAASEIARLYKVFDKVAIDLTPEYTKQRLAGEQGITWDMFPRIGFFSRPTPILDDIIRRDGAILLGAGYNLFWELLNAYKLTRTALLLPGNDETFVKADAITIRRASRGFDPGYEYVVMGELVLKAGYDHHGSVPTVGSHGGLAWSTPRSWVNGVFRALTNIDAQLQETIERLRTYETAE